MTRRWLLLIGLLCISISSGISQVTISGAFAQDTVVIGDEVDFTISLEVSSGVEILGVATYFLDSVYSALQSAKAYTDTTQPMIPMIADFELMSDGGWQDQNDDGVYSVEELAWKTTAVGSQRLMEQTFTLKLWDPGDNIVLYPAVAYIQDGVQDQLNTQEQLKVFVAPPGGLPANQDSIQVAPIKNIKEEASNFSDYLIYFIIIGLALLLGLIYWWYTKYYKRRLDSVVTMEEPEVYIPPHIIAKERLEKLKEKELWQKGDVKGYQSELTYIIREYLEGRYDIAALESTTDEIVKDLIEELNDKEDVVSLRKILQVADLVKFAKAKPDENVHESFMNEAEDFVERTKLEEKGDEEML